MADIPDKAFVMADGKQHPRGWGAAAVVENWTKEMSSHEELITVTLVERPGVATAEAVAVFLALRLLRRCNTNEENLGIVIIDRPACFVNLRELLAGRTRSWNEEHYERVLRLILNDVQRAADSRRSRLKHMIVHLVSREKAVKILGNRRHIVPNWEPHRRLDAAFRSALQHQRNRDDGCVQLALRDTAQRTWRIQVEAYEEGAELLLRVTPNPCEFRVTPNLCELPPCPVRPVPRLKPWTGLAVIDEDGNA